MRARQVLDPWTPPAVLPAGWTFVRATIGEAGETVRWYMRGDGLGVGVAVEPHASGEWLHVSLSRRSRLPSWQDIRDVKDLFVGRDRVAMQVLPRDEDYVDAHRYCFHLWSGLEGQQVLPDDAAPDGMRR